MEKLLNSIAGAFESWTKEKKKKPIPEEKEGEKTINEKVGKPFGEQPKKKQVNE